MLRTIRLLLCLHDNFPSDWTDFCEVSCTSSVQKHRVVFWCDPLKQLFTYICLARIIVACINNATGIKDRSASLIGRSSLINISSLYQWVGPVDAGWNSKLTLLLHNSGNLWTSFLLAVNMKLALRAHKQSTGEFVSASYCDPTAATTEFSFLGTCFIYPPPWKQMNKSKCKFRSCTLCSYFVSCQ
jgi:hypothetical protein